MLSMIVAPAAAPQIAALKPPPPPPVTRLDQQDEQILKIIREQGPVRIWPLLNRLTADAPGSRNARWELRVRLWGRLRRLLKLGIVWRHGRKELVEGLLCDMGETGTVLYRAGGATLGLGGNLSA